MVDDAILEILHAIQADLAAVKTDIAVHIRKLDMLQQDTRMIRGAVNDFARENVTAGEVEAIRPRP